MIVSGRFTLREEHTMTPAFAIPILEQLQRRPNDAGPTVGSPLPHAFSNQIDEREIDTLGDGRALFGRFSARRTVEVVSRTASILECRLRAFLQQPMLVRLGEQMIGCGISSSAMAQSNSARFSRSHSTTRSRSAIASSRISSACASATMPARSYSALFRI